MVPVLLMVDGDCTIDDLKSISKWKPLEAARCCDATKTMRMRRNALWRAAYFLIGLLVGFSLHAQLITFQPVLLRDHRSAKIISSKTQHRTSISPLLASHCESTPRLYHVLLTASSGPYQEWQSRVFFHHYKRLKTSVPCSDIGEFTRLLTMPKGQPPDSLASIMKTVTSVELQKGSEDFNFVVLNRPHSLRDALKRGALSHIKEQHVLLTETDHLLLKPLPNLASTTDNDGCSDCYHAVGFPL